MDCILLTYGKNNGILVIGIAMIDAYANIHADFMADKVTLIGCPKLDSVDYSEKLRSIIQNNDIKDVTVLRMEVPCCGGLEAAAQKALQESGKNIP